MADGTLIQVEQGTKISVGRIVGQPFSVGSSVPPPCPSVWESLLPSAAPVSSGKATPDV